MAARALRHTLRVAAVVMACLLVVALLAVEGRYAGIASGRARVLAAPAVASESADGGSSRRVVEAAYLSEAAAVAWMAGEPSDKPCASTDLTWDDRWILGDSDVYNHDLARACAVLTAVCNSESCWYSGTAGARPFAEETLAALGFSRVRTDSYAWRSSLLDEVGAFLTGSHEGVAYTFAAKTVDPRAWAAEGEDAPDADAGDPAAATGADPAGTPVSDGAPITVLPAEAAGDGPITLVFVGVRGSYGFEWLTNFNLGEGPDHDGYREAEAELARALTAYMGELGADPARTRVLVTGHSRGGAVANLLAARLNELGRTSQALARPEGVFAYTFASPAVSRKAVEGRYGNIFNVVSASDPVPRLPLASWGYGRHGVTVTIPRAAAQTAPAVEGGSGFAPALGLGGRGVPAAGLPLASSAPVIGCSAPFAVPSSPDAQLEDAPRPTAMEAAFLANTGVSFDADGARATADALDALEERACAFGSAAGLLPDAVDVADAAAALAALSPTAALASHYPDAYIAWLQALDEEDLVIGA